MATLFNTKISVTYPGLIKTIDNTVITATLKELTDGSGNQSGLYLNTAGDFRVTSVLEWGSLKDTGTGVTITQFVTAANGIENFNNDTTLPTSAAVKLYVDTKFSQTDTLTEVLGFGNTTSGKDIAVSAGDDVTFTDTSKILMGAGSDLSIYHDGSHSYLEDTGTGDFRLKSNSGIALLSNTNEDMLLAVPNSFVKLYFNNSEKLATKNTGVDITGDLLVTGTITGSGGSFLPLAGGTMTGNTTNTAGTEVRFGDNNELGIFHSSSISNIRVNSGNLVIRADDLRLTNKANNKFYLKGIVDAAVELYYDNSKKLETTTSGVTITGGFSTNATSFSNGNIFFYDNKIAVFGNNSDLQIYHDGSNSYIQDTGTGSLKVFTSNFVVNNADDSQNMIIATDGGGVRLYYNGIKRIETVTDGAKVEGNLEVTGTITGAGGSFLPLIGGTMTGNTIHNDNVKSVYGTNSDLEIFHSGTDSFIKDVGTGNLKIRATNLNLQSEVGANYVTCISGGAVELSHNNVLKFATTSSGISVTGNGAFTGNVTIPTSQKLELGNSAELFATHDGSSIIRSTTGSFYIDNAAGTQSTIFRTSDASTLDTTALIINRSGDLITGRNVTIAGDLTVNGTTTTVNSQTLSVVDPLISLATANAANSLDIGFYGKYNDGTPRYLGLFNDASDSNKFKLFKGTTVEPTTTVNLSGAGYVAADLVVADLDFDNATGDGTIIMQGTATQTIRLIDNTQGVTLSSFAQNSSGGFGTFSSHNMIFYSNSNVALTLDTSQNATFAGNVALAGGSLSITGDGSNAATLTESSVGIFTIAAVDDIILDAAGDIALDAGGDDIRFRVNGTTYGSFNNASSNLNIYSSIQDKSIKFLGNDGGTQITALTLNMADGGDATFAGNVTIGSSGAGSNKTLNILTGGTKSSVKLMEAGTVYGFSTVYDGASNKFHINRHNNSAAGTPVLSLNRDDDNATFAGTINSGSITSTGVITAATTFKTDSGSMLFFVPNVGQALEIAQNTGNATFAGEVAIRSDQGTSNNAVLRLRGSNTTNRITRLQFEDYSGALADGLIQFRVPTSGVGSSAILELGVNSASLTLDASQNATFSGNIAVNNSIASIAPTTDANNLLLIENTNASGSCNIRLRGGDGATRIMYGKNGGTDKLFITPRNADTSHFILDQVGNATIAGDVTINGAEYVNQIQARTSAGLTLGNDNNSGLIFIDDNGDISLDAGGNDIRFKVSNVEFGKIKQDSGSLAIFSSIEDEDILFKGNDGGSTIEALKLDMSEGGTATFAGDVQLGDDKRLILGASTDGTIQYDGTNDELEIKTAADASEISLIAGTTNTYTSEIQIGARSSSQGEGIFFKTRSVERMRIKSSGSIYSVNSIQGTYFGQDAGNPASVTGVGNTSIGYATAQLLTSGAQNTSVGRSASVNLTTGSNNTAIGKEALFALIGGDNNTAIGTSAGSNITSGTNNTCLGFDADTPSNSTTNTVVLGNTVVQSLRCQVALTVVSDKRDKLNFENVPYGLDFVDKLKPTSFEFKKEGNRNAKESDGIKRYGFIAQDILELEGENSVIINNKIPEKLVYTESNLIPVLVKAIQELKAEIELLKAK